jgi:hypothetical protein
MSLLLIVSVHKTFNYFVSIFTIEKINDPMKIQSAQNELLTKMSRQPNSNSSTKSPSYTSNIIINKADYL